jgi:site-specific DNA recombinase
MLTVDLYIRVSTDEQADRGYSQRDQEERLRKYCDQKQYTVRKVIYEDHSAKSFERPEWKKLLLDLRRYKGKSDLILFTKWDRFSRNTGDAYSMINTLRKLGVEPQAIEQPLDMSVPESKIMLAIHLSAPEVENDRRALNVFNGMRRARKEGRWMGPAPIGYLNKAKEDGSRYIAIHEDEAKHIRWIFQELSRRIFNSEQVWKMAVERGLKCSKHNFWLAIRNPVFCGKIFVAKYKEEEERLVPGQHEGIISEELFREVQDVLDGRGRIYRPKSQTQPEFPLRGFLICPRCGKILTASTSKGRNNYYSYYHCAPRCGIRFKAEETNSGFVTELRKYVPKRGMVNVYGELIMEEFKEMTYHTRHERNKVLKQIEVIGAQLNKARKDVLHEKIDAADFKIMKVESEKEINVLESKIIQLPNDTRTIENITRRGMDNLISLDERFEKGTVKEQREIVGSIYPENLTFDGEHYRTARLNEAVRQIYLIEKELQENKNGTSEENFNLCRKADWTGLEPATSAVTGRHSNQLNYQSNRRFRGDLRQILPSHLPFFGMAKIGEF